MEAELIPQQFAQLLLALEVLLIYRPVFQDVPMRDEKLLHRREEIELLLA